MRITTTRRAAVLLMLFALLFVGKANANNAQEARKMLDRTWKMVFGPEGCSLNYSVNIIGIYKTQGSIAIKGKKQHFVEKRYCAWNNGKKLYSVDLKKKKVELHNPQSPKRDKYASKFTYALNDYNYSWAKSKEGIVITLNAKKGVDSSVKHAKVVLNPKNYYPVSLHIKVAFFWTKVYITNFKAGNISDRLFDYPAARFKDYIFKNCWPD